MLARQPDSILAVFGRSQVHYPGLCVTTANLQATQEIAMDGNPDYFVHESSYIDEQVEVGDGTTIWHFCHILAGSRLGEKCRIGQNVVIGPRVQIGKNVKIQNNVSVYEGVTLEDNVFCGPSIVFTNINTPRSAFPRNRSSDNLSTLVRCGASIGANATIICGNTIGQHALIGAGSVITKDVPDHAIVFGNPARQQGWACECGVTLTFHDTIAVCSECERKYKIKEACQVTRVNQQKITS